MGPSTLPQIHLLLDESQRELLFSQLLEPLVIPGTIEFILERNTERRRCEVSIHGASSRFFSAKQSLDIELNGNISLHHYLPPSMRSICAASSDDLILNAAAFDMSKIRSFLSMATTHRLGGVVPAMGFAELYINQSYYGLVTMSEKITPTWVRQKTATSGAFDLIKAVGWGADLRPKEDPLLHYELKYGNSTGLGGTMDWLAAFNGSCSDIFMHTDTASVFGYPMGVLLSGDGDAFGKNYYYLHHILTQKFQILRWDGDAAWGRGWDGSECSLIWQGPPQTNQLYQILWNDSSWRAELKQRFEQKFEQGFDLQLIELVDSLYELLQEPLVRDLQKWGPILIPTFANFFGVNSWPNYTEHNPQQLIDEEFAMIRNYISTSHQRMLDELARP
jgi:hypothetical protein